ncbi:MAG: proline iminopeptidase-family hydrolase [Geminicoccaceae bacterium]
MGNGRSTHLPEAPAEFWCVEKILEELEALLRHLGIERRYNLLGQSWGGMLAAEHAVRRPPGLNALVIADAPASMVTWREEMDSLRRRLPEQVQRTLELHEANEDYQHPDYQAASRIFYGEHLCRVVPLPDEVQRTIDWIGYDPTVYGTMNGPTEFLVIGKLKDWSIEDRLHEVEVPTLVISGRHDEATPRVVEGYATGIKGAVRRIFEGSSHMPHIEEQAACLLTVSAFLHDHDAAGAAVQAT